MMATSVVVAVMVAAAVTAATTKTSMATAMAGVTDTNNQKQNDGNIVSHNGGGQ